MLSMEGGRIMVTTARHAPCSRRTVATLALIVAVALRSLYAAPAAAAAHWSAVACCAQHCHHGQHGRQPDRCCQVASSATDAATLTQGISIDPPTTPGCVAVLVPAASCERRDVRPVRLVPAAGRQRLFITTRSLRL
jgi:hypothetical protein